MSKNKEAVYIVDCCRTAIGSTNKSLKKFEAQRLAAFVIERLLETKASLADKVTEVILGNTVSAGTGQNLARQALKETALPLSVPAYVVNNVCGSGLQAVIAARQKLLLEEDGFVIAGATESATHNPALLFGKEDSPKDSLIEDGLFCSLSNKHMGEICEELAKKENISREDQDAYALRSHQKACLAREAGAFKEEIVPIVVSGEKTFEKDERPREKTSCEKLAALPPAFDPEGTVTAGNASSAADGACGFLLAQEKTLKEQKIKPLAKIVEVVSLGVEPAHVFQEGVLAIQQCLEKGALKLSDIDLFEVTEAFSAQALYTQRILNIPEEKMNVYGGDVALGHPLGIAGARALVTLVHALKAKKKKRGLVYTAFGAGGAIAMVIEV